MADVAVSGLTYYPIKGCAGVPVERATVTEAGLRFDRELMLVDQDDGTFLSQRVLPAMAAVRVAVLDDGAGVRIAAPGVDEAEIEIAEDGPRREVSLFNRWFGPGVDQGDAAAKWFSTALDRPCRLVRVPPEHERTSSGLYTGPIRFTDGHALVLISESSLAGLNERITAGGGPALPMNRFRPNIVVSGWTEPHTEDSVRRAEIGTLEFGFANRCIRCAVPTVDQETGRKDGPEPTRTLATYRRDVERGGVAFGMKAAVVRPGTIAVGDEVRVLDWA